ncbi:MAG: hypothetical protein AABX54_01120 [Nanoarchaeota archaeon]
MVDSRVLDDFKAGDWIGIHYQEPEKDFYCFPTIVEGISNRNKNPLEEVVEVTMSPETCPRTLKREYISRIWKIGEVHT